MIELTKQQTNIINTICNAVNNHSIDNPMIITIEAVAGASKTFTLKETAKAFKLLFPSETFRYMLFGRLAYEEAKENFGTTAICSTIHQIAYHHMIKLGDMKLNSTTNYLNYKDIPSAISTEYNVIKEALIVIQEFIQSTETNITTFMTKVKTKTKLAVIDILDALYHGQIKCTHDIYLKMFHIDLIENNIKLEPVSILAIDEVQDLSPIMLALVDKYPAKVKVLVGDPNQSIFSFMGCINAFTLYKEATKLHLTKSFRCSIEIAKKVEYFMKLTVDKHFIFEGNEYKTTEINTSAILTRTNSSLIRTMIELNNKNTTYKLSTKEKLTQIFGYPLAIIRAKPGNIETNPKYKHIQAEIDKLQKINKIKIAKNENPISKYTHLYNIYKEDKEIAEAIKLIVKFSAPVVLTTYEKAKINQKKDTNLSIMTVHTSKGSTFDEVTLSEDLNESIEEVLKQFKKTNILNKEELYIYYVAVTRARHKVINAKYLQKINLIQKLCNIK